MNKHKLGFLFISALVMTLMACSSCNERKDRPVVTGENSKIYTHSDYLKLSTKKMTEKEKNTLENLTVMAFNSNLMLARSNNESAITDAFNELANVSGCFIEVFGHDGIELSRTISKQTLTYKQEMAAMRKKNKNGFKHFDSEYKNKHSCIEKYGY